MFKQLMICLAVLASSGAAIAQDDTGLLPPTSPANYHVLESVAKSGEAVILEQINDSNFDEKIAEGVVLVDFYTEWCVPCRRLSIVLEEVAKELGDAVAIKKAKVEDNPKKANQYNIRCIPTLILFKDGQEVNRRIGFCYPDELKEFIFSAL